MEKFVGVPEEVILSRIFQVRGKKVMLSPDLAELYQVETKRLNEQVKRNPGKFPERYAFRLSIEEHQSLRSQFATLKRGKHPKYPPYAFTEHGILMLSNVLRSERADKVSLQIIDAFVRLNELVMTHADILLKLEELDKRVSGQDEKIKVVIDYLKQFIKDANEPRKLIGYKR
ncbi:MAG: ORF6N domain-containing protein [Flavobacteriales bacterium]|nr:ORF6N domain-containing protein [Flavobacteriales bacterium]